MDAFPDRRKQLFGREQSIDYLTRRVARPGLTAVAGRPLMGKTWTLIEVARRLQEDDRFLVGYRESRGLESSQLLYAVADLYARWLENATFLDQARSFWERHKDELVSKAGQLFGAIIDKLGKGIVGEGLAGLVRSMFDGLAEAQKDLLTGGIQLPTLSYDQAHSLSQLVNRVSGRKVVLILDAWEFSPGQHSELTTLESFVRSLHEWPNTHVVLGVRHPDFPVRESNLAYEHVVNLCGLDPSAERLELEPMDLTEFSESTRLTNWLRENLLLAPDVTDQALIDLIAGNPGVIKFWMHEAKRDQVQTLETLRAEAANAQANRYPELQNLLRNLEEIPALVSARLAFLPRSDDETWTEFRELILKDATETVIHGLVDDGVLADERFPTYGHDTRHVAARKWLSENKLPHFRRTAERCIEELSSRMTGNPAVDRRHLETLSFNASLGYSLKVSPVHLCLLDAARTCFEREAIDSESFDKNYKTALARDPTYAALVAIALINRGATRSRAGNIDGGLADYNTVINISGVPPQQFVLALNNRALIKTRRGDFAGAIADLDLVIESNSADPIKQATFFFNRALAKDQQGDTIGAVRDYTTAIDSRALPSESLLKSLGHRARLRTALKDLTGAFEDFSHVVDFFPNASTELTAEALIERGTIYGRWKFLPEQCNDYSRALSLSDIDVGHRSRALLYRGHTYFDLGEYPRAITDYDSVIVLKDAPMEDVAAAYNNRARVKGETGDFAGQIEDYTAVIDCMTSPPKEMVNAFENRGIWHSQHGSFDAAVRDWSSAIKVPGASLQEVASACLRLATHAASIGNLADANQLYTQVINSPTSGEILSDALTGRGWMHTIAGQCDLAIQDFDAALAHPDITEQLREIAQHGREAAVRQKGIPPSFTSEH